MMKKLLFLICALPLTALGQTLYVPNASTTGIANSSTGNVGIGVSAPSRQLHLKLDKPFIRFEMDSDQYSMIEWYETTRGWRVFNGLDTKRRSASAS